MDEDEISEDSDYTKPAYRPPTKREDGEEDEEDDEKDPEAPRKRKRRPSSSGENPGPAPVDDVNNND